MNLDITKVANVILYMLHKQVKQLNDKKLSIMLFLMDYNHLKFCKEKIFGDEYIKEARHPQPKILGEIFEVIANEEDLDEDDEKYYLIRELYDYLDIEILEKENFIELKFSKVYQEFDDELFSEDELKTINKIVNEYKETSPRNIANETFKIDQVRNTQIGQIIL